MLIVAQLYYSTATPGRFYVYYDVTSSRIGGSSGSSATIGAQGDSTGELLLPCLPASCRPFGALHVLLLEMSVVAERISKAVHPVLPKYAGRSQRRHQDRVRYCLYGLVDKGLMPALPRLYVLWVCLRYKSIGVFLVIVDIPDLIDCI